MTQRIKLLTLAQADVTRLIDLCFPAMDAATPLILGQVDHALRGTDFQNLRDDAQLVLAEALNNVVEHAYASTTLGAVALRVESVTDQLEIHLTDWGNPFPSSTIPEGRNPNPNDLSEGGYGWFLIRSLTSEIRYFRKIGRNCLSLIFSV